MLHFQVIFLNDQSLLKLTGTLFLEYVYAFHVKLYVHVRVNLEEKVDYCRQLLIGCVSTVCPLVSTSQFFYSPRATIKLSMRFVPNFVLRPVSTVTVTRLIGSLLRVLLSVNSNSQFNISFFRNGWEKRCCCNCRTNFGKTKGAQSKKNLLGRTLESAKTRTGCVSFTKKRT